MASIRIVNDALRGYKKWVTENPGRATEMETVTKWLSYFVAGKINKSPILSELVYSVSNLFSLYNDLLIRKSQNNPDQPKNVIKERLKLWLTILHYCEVFIEITSRNKWGNRGKWSAATVVQIIRCISNLVLIHQHSEIPIQQPPIPTLLRSKFTQQNVTEEFNNDGFVLKRSRRIIRKVEAAPPINLRDWKPLNNDSRNSALVNVGMGDMEKKKFAETLYVIKPLVHLGSVACFGSETWKQWLTFLGFDLFSLHLYSDEMASLDLEQRSEINRRKLSLLLYLLRSPVYQKHSAVVIDNFLNSVSKNVPLMSIICNPILHYISHWQDTYFYMWPN